MELVSGNTFVSALTKGKPKAIAWISGNKERPNHVGDMPPLLGNNGYAWSSFYDSRFTIEEIINKSIVIHSMRDDFTSQPAGDSGEKIGCGVIVPFR